jgi:hypothetical protein
MAQVTVTKATFEDRAIWKGIDRWKTPFSTIVRQMPGLTPAFAVTNTRPWATLGAMEKVHAREPHYYLEILGTRRSAQGKGIGSTVMEGCSSAAIAKACLRTWSHPTRGTSPSTPGTASWSVNRFHVLLEPRR